MLVQALSFSPNYVSGRKKFEPFVKEFCSLSAEYLNRTKSRDAYSIDIKTELQTLYRLILVCTLSKINSVHVWHDKG